jgi:predicted ATPase/signal transduction histidine kinase
MAAGDAVLETLRDDGELVLSRRVSTDDRSKTFLMLTPVSDRASPGTLKRLAYEYSLRDQLEAAWAVRPIAFLHEQGLPAMILEDPGGRLLQDLVGMARDLPALLRLAIDLAEMVGRAHARGLIHKDIKPTNILFDPATRASRLIGFGIASRLPRERRPPEAPKEISGTLAYMAPEQTGRMNRSVDSRSDLYSLGVTFYELLTGTLPFQVSDPMEWIHCHIARHPMPACEREAGIPEQVSRIIGKLLAKAAEDRYQTAAGIAGDLRRCLDELETGGRISTFVLATADVPDRLVISEKLYGRERDVQKLLAAFDRVVATREIELVIVSGYSGIGKSSLVNELHKALVPQHGLFASGKFEQYRRDIPYSTLTRALGGVIRWILTQSEQELARWCVEIERALGHNGGLIAGMIPELELIIGPQPAPSELAPAEAQNRFQMVFRDFISVLARPEHPLVLFLDDLQWLDSATLKLLETIATTPGYRSLLLVGAYRDNEVHAAHPLTSALRTIRDSGTRVTDVVLTPLDVAEVTELISDALRADPAGVTSLARLVHEKTGGNPFFVVEFLSELSHEGLIAISASGSPSWDTERIESKGYTDNIVDLMAGKVTRLGPSTREAVIHLACLGMRASIATLARTRNRAEVLLEEDLWPAVRAGIVLRSDDTYLFPHDRIHEAAYALIDEQRRIDAHLHIGRLLASALGPDASSEQVFDVVHQLNRAVARIVDPAERAQLRALNVHAARKAKASIAYASACDYLRRATELSSTDDPWTAQYADTFEVSLLLAECEFLAGNHHIADQLFELIRARASTVVDRAAAYCVQLQLFQVAGRFEEGFQGARDELRLFDIAIPDSDDELMAAVAEEHANVSVLLAGRRVADVCDGAPVTDRRQRALMDLLVYAGPCAFNGSPKHFPLVTLRAVTLSLRNGNTDVSCRAYAAYAVMLVSMFDDPQRAYEFSEMALRLNDQIGKRSDRGALLMMHGHMVVPWLRPFSEAMAIQEQALAACLDGGDLAYAGYVAFLRVWQLVESGSPLEDVTVASVKYAELSRQMNHDIASKMILLEQLFVARLQGTSAIDPREEAACVDGLLKSTFGSGIGSYYIMKEVTAFHQRRFEDALSAAEEARPFLPTVMALPIGATHHFYRALALAALRGPDALPEIKEATARFAQWSTRCPANFAGRHALLEAEIARIEGRDLDAIRSYEAACSIARSAGRMLDKALALELSARFFAARGLDTAACVHLREARARYAQAGAHTNVARLEAEHSFLRGEPARGVATIGTRVENLELATVVRVLQALSSDIRLEKWLEQFMTLALHDAGAERAILFAPSTSGLECLAEAKTDAVGVTVRATQDPPVAASILRYVARTRETVLLDDAATSPYADDPYIASRRSRSVLCLPLVRSGTLAGVLYLENDLAKAAFTPERTTVLKLVVAQAAVFIENARLYTKLQHENEARKRTEDALRRSEAYLAEAQRLSHTGSFGWNVSTGEIVWSEETYRIFGFDRSEVPTLDKIFRRMHPDDLDRVRDTLERVPRAHDNLDFNLRLVWTGGEVRLVHILGHFVPGRTDDVIEYVGAAMDITEQHEATLALQRSQSELAHVMRVTSLGELAASIAHEVNQPLAAMGANASAALNWLGAQPPALERVREALGAIESDSERGGEIVARIRRLLKRSTSGRGACDINTSMKTVIDIARPALERHHVTVAPDLADNLPAVHGDQVLLQQVVLNLLMNAADACKGLEPSRREIQVTTRLEAEHVCVCVVDKGKGIDPESRARLFEPFYTTKPDGLGMGLSISRSIVARHGGQLRALANADHGTTFTFTLPVS